MYYPFHCTQLGFSHTKDGRVCQDYSLSGRSRNGVAYLAIVSDGHGSSNFTRSDRGSRFACTAAWDAIEGFLEGVELDWLTSSQTRDQVVLQLCKNIILRWNQQVDDDFSANPFTPEEVKDVKSTYRQRYLNGEAWEHAYGATLIAVVITPDFCLAIRNGDGECVAADASGAFSAPIPWNENCISNVTTSLCGEDAISNFRWWFTQELPAAVFLGSDGVDDSYTSKDELFNLYRNLCFQALDEGPDTLTGCLEQLLPEITRRGSTDDVSIAGLLDPSRLSACREQMMREEQERSLRLQEERRKQQARVAANRYRNVEKQLNKKWEDLRSNRNAISALKREQNDLSDRMRQITRKKEQNVTLLSDLEQKDQKLEEEVRQLEQQLAELQQQLGPGWNAPPQPSQVQTPRPGQDFPPPPVYPDPPGRTVRIDPVDPPRPGPDPGAGYTTSYGGNWGSFDVDPSSAASSAASKPGPPSSPAGLDHTGEETTTESDAPSVPEPSGTEDPSPESQQSAPPDPSRSVEDTGPEPAPAQDRPDPAHWQDFT